MKGKGSKKHRAKGGMVDGVEAAAGGGDPDVVKEAEEKKKGGKVEGKKPKHHMGRKARKARKAGGRVGADSAPLTEANTKTSPEALPKSQEGGISK